MDLGREGDQNQRYEGRFCPDGGRFIMCWARRRLRHLRRRVNLRSRLSLPFHLRMECKDVLHMARRSDVWSPENAKLIS